MGKNKKKKESKFVKAETLIKKEYAKNGKDISIVSEVSIKGKPFSDFFAAINDEEVSIYKFIDDNSIEEFDRLEWESWESVKVDHFFMKSIFVFSSSSSTKTINISMKGKEVLTFIQRNTSLESEIVPRPWHKKILGFRSGQKWKMVTSLIIYLLVFSAIISSFGESEKVSVDSQDGVNTSVSTMASENSDHIPRVKEEDSSSSKDDLSNDNNNEVQSEKSKTDQNNEDKTSEVSTVKDNDNEKKTEEKSTQELANPPPPSGILTVHYIDVGQGDSTLLQGPDFNILIDAGKYNANDVVPYLKAAGITELDLIVGTHPHADHIGQIDKVIQSLKVKEVWFSGDTHTSKTFERVLDAVLSSDASYHEPRAGETFEIGSSLIEVVNPKSLTGDFHEGSVSMRIIYGDVFFLFTGDAESHTEQAILSRNHNVNAQIFQLGHHGSSTSNTKAFLEKIQPEIVVYSAGKDNSYGHPHAEVIERIKEMKINIYGTDTHGHIQVITDGKAYEVKTSKSGEVIVPTTSETSEEDVTQEESKSQEEKVSSCGPGTVNINTASFDDLRKIKHINVDRAQQVINLRPFRSIDDLVRIKGIATKRLEDIKVQGIACAD
jgi:competence protein ComEC